MKKCGNIRGIKLICIKLILYAKDFYGRLFVVEHLKVQLGNILVNNNVITRDTLDEATIVAKDKDLEFDEFLVTFGYVSEKHIVDAKVVLYDTPSIDLKGIHIEPAILNMIPSNILRKDKILPICLHE